MKPDPWTELERNLFGHDVQPKGSITSEQYASTRDPKIGICEAQKRLLRLFKAGMARRDKWGGRFVYWPIPQKEK